ncbi:carboxymuconolactone decarboxylase family protein [Deefgea piscis]|uniref:Carboxymuconolactone decarboxylase family protein n=1 Tax=Deefgea piscis TaxID=2739061 RepID=A0A6M8SQ34_9NEIS|nr:carboxymuconolactone decarboxylase family protein [Deefgea piscis]QKJ67383.1 carboxymuconolactone decarboxylase family protein [Deefgea piscis]QZA79589.1 carboxymuconolactone decarboxylase family protein [Deefgea piscis]
MTENYRDLVQSISGKLRQFAKEIPETQQGFMQTAKATHTEGALSKKHKELMAMSIAIAARCQGCLGFHAQACVKLGVTRAEFMEMLQVAIYMGGGPSVMTGAEALIAFEEYGGEKAAE